MPKGSPELTNARKQEIIEACKTLYEEQSFDSVSILKIAEYTSFTRTSIYNYFETKEEIVLALLQREYELFVEDLNHLCEEKNSLSGDELASELAHALERRMMMLKLLSMNLYDMEANSRMERLIEFKAAYGESKNEAARQTFLYAFLPFVYGLYPYTMVTEKQKEAMNVAGISYVYMSTYDMAYTSIRTLLKGLH